MKKIFNIIILNIFLVSGFVSACKKVEMLDSTKNENKPVVVAILMPDNQLRVKVHEIFYFEDNSETNQPVENLDVYVSSGGKTVLLTEVPDSGIYVSDSLPIIEGETYKLHFLYKGKLVESETTVPLKPSDFTISDDYISIERIEEGEFGFPQMVDLELTWKNDKNDYYLIEVKYMNSTPDYINANMADKEISTVMYSQPMIGEAYDVQPMMISFFGTYRVIIYHLTNDYAQLHENISGNSNNLSDPPTNIINGWGIFSGMNSDTLFLEVVESQ